LLPRTLSLRLRQLNAEGLIEKVPDPAGGRKHTYQLTAQGKDIWPVLTALTDYGSRYHSQQVFEDGRPRGVEETFPESAALMMGRLVDFARSADPIETPNGGRAGSNRGRSSAPPVSDARRRSR
jgi:DNA-binding MarR family transcriptional regulator